MWVAYNLLRLTFKVNFEQFKVNFEPINLKLTKPSWKTTDIKVSPKDVHALIVFICVLFARHILVG